MCSCKNKSGSNGGSPQAKSFVNNNGNNNLSVNPQQSVKKTREELLQELRRRISNATR
jgi:hypothetical protein